MTAQEARNYAVEAIKKLVESGRTERDNRYCLGQCVGMVKAFRAAGIIDDTYDLLDELEKMI